MIFLFDSNIGNNNALAQGATWFNTRARTLTPLDAGFYLAAQNAPFHDVTIMIDGANGNRIDNNAIAPALAALNAGEAVIIVAHGRGQTRTLHSEAGGRNVTVTATTIVQHLLQAVAPPHTIFIAACEGGIITGGRSILSTVTGNVFNGQSTIGGYVGQAALTDLTAVLWNLDGNGNAINANRRGTHIWAFRASGGQSYHMGYDLAVTTTYTHDGNYSNLLSAVTPARLVRFLPRNAFGNPELLVTLNDAAFILGRIPTTITPSLERTS